MGVIISYQIALPDIGLKLSNDAYGGDLILDADIKAEMARGVAGGSFEIKLYDLPLKKANELFEKVKTAHRGTVRVKLGYMDSFSGLDAVMEGIFTKVTTSVDSDRLVTTIKGLETGTHALTKTRSEQSLAGATTVRGAVSTLLEQAKITEGEIARQARCTLTDDLQDATLRGESLLEILDSIAQRAGAELLVVDKRVSIGKPIRDDDYGPKPFTRDSNLAVFRPFVKEVPAEEGDNVLEKIPPADAIGFNFTIAGDAKLRPGQRVATNLDGYDRAAGEFRIHTLVHNFSSSTGYVCEGIALVVCTDERCRRQEEALTLPSADAVVQGLTRRIQRKAKTRPSIEIGAIKSHDPAKHRATVYYGQRFRPTETQPSVRAEVEAKADQLLTNKPLISPFAWHKCGLVTPVYAGMKAALVHNLDLPDDALVAGFVWSETPAIEPPASQTGDWWLCLPIDVASGSSPSDSTKAANDLTTKSGKRVISVKGLKIGVGTSSLSTVGGRPTEGGDDELLIEHSSGTRLTIASDGKVSIEASEVSIVSKGNVNIEGAAVAIKGNVSIDGNVEIK